MKLLGYESIISIISLLKDKPPYIYGEGGEVIKEILSSWEKTPPSFEDHLFKTEVFWGGGEEETRIFLSFAIVPSFEALREIVESGNLFRDQDFSSPVSVVSFIDSIFVTMEDISRGVSVNYRVILPTVQKKFYARGLDGDNTYVISALDVENFSWDSLSLRLEGVSGNSFSLSLSSETSTGSVLLKGEDKESVKLSYSFPSSSENPEIRIDFLKDSRELFSLMYRTETGPGSSRGLLESPGIRDFRFRYYPSTIEYWPKSLVDWFFNQDILVEIRDSDIDSLSLWGAENLGITPGVYRVRDKEFLFELKKPSREDVSYVEYIPGERGWEKTGHPPLVVEFSEGNFEKAQDHDRALFTSVSFVGLKSSKKRIFGVLYKVEINQVTVERLIEEICFDAQKFESLKFFENHFRL